MSRGLAQGAVTIFKELKRVNLPYMERKEEMRVRG